MMKPTYNLICALLMGNAMALSAFNDDFFTQFFSRDPFFNRVDVLDNIEASIKQAEKNLQALKERIEKEDEHSGLRKSIKQLRELLEKIKPEVSQKDDMVTISIKAEGFDKDKVTVNIDDNKVRAYIPVKSDNAQITGIVDLIITQNYIETVRQIEIQVEDQKQKRQQNYYSTTGQWLPDALAIDVNSAKASTKENELTIEFTQKKQKQVTIKHF